MKRLFYTPSEDDKQRVRKYAASGASEDDIAALLDVPVKRLRKAFKKELKQGEAEGKQVALDKLHDVVREGSNVSALIFWVKARCGWRDTGAAPDAAGPVQSILMIQCDSE